MTGKDRPAEEARIRALHETCGCDTGAAFALIALACYGFVVFVLNLEPPWGIGWSALAVFIAAGASGKLFGVLRAERRIRRELRS